MNKVGYTKLMISTHIPSAVSSNVVLLVMMAVELSGPSGYVRLSETRQVYGPRSLTLSRSKETVPLKINDSE